MTSFKAGVVQYVTNTSLHLYVTFTCLVFSLITSQYSKRKFNVKRTFFSLYDLKWLHFIFMV